VEPQIIIGGDPGFHNKDLRAAQARLKEGRQYKDLSTVCVIPTRGLVPARAVETWMSLQTPMNNRFLRIFVAGMEVGDAYEKAVEMILGHPYLKTFKYLLTLEEDNLPPSDGLLNLYKSICDCKKVCNDHFAQVAGLYFTKGEQGQPMIYGNPKGLLTFEPQLPQIGKVQECNGTGMGFTLFHMGLFRDKRIERPWFKTVQEGNSVGTQDLYFMGKVRKAGYRIASDNRIQVGHLDVESGVVY
jgi:hypothetical protein